MDYRTEYVSRVNRVIDYIESNLAEELQLDTPASVAAFSTFHFHRIFRAITGEPLYSFIQRFRLEKAAGQLVTNPKKLLQPLLLIFAFLSDAYDLNPIYIQALLVLAASIPFCRLSIIGSSQKELK